MDVAPNNSVLFHTYMPDGKGGWQPVPAIQTKEEAVRYLRLDQSGAKNPLDSLDYLIQRGDLRPTRMGRVNVFRTPELDECARKRTELCFDRREPRSRKRSLK